MRFTKLPSDFWNSKSGRAVRASGPHGFAIYWYLRSSAQANYIGMYNLNVGYTAVDLGISNDVVMEYVKKFEEASLVSYDPANEIIWIIDQAQVQVGELKKGDKRIVGVNKDVAAIARSTIRDGFFSKYHQLLNLCDTLAPLQPGITPAPTHSKMGDMSLQAAQTPAALEKAAGESYLEGVLSVLLLMREADRETYSEVRDMCVREDAEIISKEVGARRAADLIHNAIVTGDLGLVAALKSISLRDI